MTSNQKLRIIHCFRSPVGGVFRHVRDLIDQHVKDGHEVGILCDSLTGGEYEERLFKELEPMLALGIHRFAIRRSIRPSDILSLYRSYKVIKACRPDIIHGHSAKGGAIARVIGTLLRANGSHVARLYSPHGGSLHYQSNSLKGRLFFAAERLFERFTEALCFVCDYERKTYIEKIGRPRPLTRTIYNGVREEEFSPITLDSQARDFLYIGMMRDLKGPQIFIEAIHALTQSTGVTISAHMVGDGPDKDRYRQQIINYGLSSQVTLHDAMPARQAFAMARCVVIPSLAEAMPYIVLEAAAAGKQIIATGVGGIPEILGEDHPNLVPAGDVAALAKAMATAMNTHFENGKNATGIDQERFRAQFSAKAMGDEMLCLYHSLLQPRATVKTNKDT